MIPFNPATGEFNPLANPIEMTVEGDRLVAEVTFSNVYESAPDTVQGGMVAGSILATGALILASMSFSNFSSSYHTQCSLTSALDGLNQGLYPFFWQYHTRSGAADTIEIARPIVSARPTRPTRCT